MCRGAAYWPVWLFANAHAEAGATLQYYLSCHVQENDVERDFQIHRSDQDYALAEFFRWTIAFLIGVAMGCLGFMVDWGIETLNNFKYNNTFDIVNSVGARCREPCARCGLALLM